MSSYGYNSSFCDSSFCVDCHSHFDICVLADKLCDQGIKWAEGQSRFKPPVYNKWLWVLYSKREDRHFIVSRYLPLTNSIVMAYDLVVSPWFKPDLSAGNYGEDEVMYAKTVKCAGKSQAINLALKVEVLSGIPWKDYERAINGPSDKKNHFHVLYSPGKIGWHMKCSTGLLGPENNEQLLSFDQMMKLADVGRITTFDLYDSPEYVQAHDDGRFPHKCPDCGAPAYVGMTQVDCSVSCRRRTS